VHQTTHHGRNHQRHHQRNQTNNLHPGTILSPRVRQCSASADPNFAQPGILQINQATPTEFTYPSISHFYQCQEERPLPPPPVPKTQTFQEAIPWSRVSPTNKIHQLMFENQELNCHFLEKIYVSSVLPTQTPRELRHFQQHCFNIYQHQEGLDVIFDQGLNRIRQITSSPLVFCNLLWKTKTTLSISGIEECYCWIR
jgi:hypothetical protein